MRRARRIGARYYRAIRLRKYRAGIGIPALRRRCDHVCLRTLAHVHTYTYEQTRAYTGAPYIRGAYAYISNEAVILSVAAGHERGGRVVVL